MPEILHLNLHREFFSAIASKTKNIEYRKQSPYWRKRLEGREYDVILFRNGYAKHAPEMQVEFRGLRRYGKGRAAYYAIRLGRILKIKRWPKEASVMHLLRRDSNSHADCAARRNVPPLRWAKCDKSQRRATVISTRCQAL